MANYYFVEYLSGIKLKRYNFDSSKYQIPEFVLFFNLNYPLGLKIK